LNRRQAPFWHVKSDHAVAGFTHAVPPGFGHALLAPIISRVFRALRVGASLRHLKNWWFSLHDEPNVIAFEVEHSRSVERGRYNARQIAKAQRTRRACLGEFRGTSDICVPIVAAREVLGFLIAGPFARERPTSIDILERWRSLTGRQGHLSDAEFAAYLSTTLGTLVLEGELTGKFQELLVCLGKLMAGEGQADALANRADALRVELERVRDVEVTWEAVRQMVDERTTQTWDSLDRVYSLYRLGLPRRPDQALVALTTSVSSSFDPVDEAVRRDAFQRAAVSLAASAGGAVAGQVGDHGVVLLLASTGSSQRRRMHMLDLAARTEALARRFDIKASFGACTVGASSRIHHAYEAALRAAESALVQGARIVDGEPGRGGAPHSLRHLRQALRGAVDEQPHLLSARFDRYLEAVALEHGYRLETARGYLEAGFDRLAQTLLDTRRLDEKSFQESGDALERAARGARTMQELLSAYRRAAQDLSDAVKRPREARHDRGLRAALAYIDRHYTEPLKVESVARIAGFATNYFSKLFSLREKMTFVDYVALRRIEHAKHLLSATDLDATRIAELSGFNSAQYFSRIFRRATGTTPLGYRQHPAPSGGPSEPWSLPSGRKKRTKRN
jgi:AraC-like DNA-binding protein